MNYDQYDKAKKLERKIDSLKRSFDALMDEENYLDIPQEMFDRHIAEKRDFLEKELSRLEAEFAAL